MALVQMVVATGSGTTAAVSITAKAGNFLVAFSFFGLSSGSATPTVAGGGTWTVDASGAVAATHCASIASCPSATGGAQTVTATCTNGGLGTIVVMEFTEMPNATPVKSGTPPAAKTGSGTSASSNNLQNLDVQALFCGLTVNDNSANPATETITSSGWVAPAGAGQLNGAVDQTGFAAYHIVNSIVNDQVTFTITTGAWLCLITCYKYQPSPQVQPAAPNFGVQGGPEFDMAVPVVQGWV